MGQQKKAAAKNYQVRISNNALKNIDEITGYIAFINNQPINAIKIGDKIFNSIDRISANPLAFKECELLRTKSKMYRRAACLSWSIIYRVKPGEVLILGIIHQSRRPVNLLPLKKLK
ncbi:type II toxin-antitoxin system RelE/ParE family toxin [Flavihumibacter fluvii]|uniref:type II toxin-antitoxin system RelE/ParE family toxin n=1 Tax=Flavihumibacter fluvii TaxID=2838157 RepID=UPI001BDF5BB7|nr:type II toxin-antitoxin system RelE/ParE family toxin [Flavihumibacter fluvii]ULQ52381.1 type II toxin-antitoxin system RelE/ParE family toxin [Flavihumibacter fluvii]